uniref:Uncharacterized protein n=1 Tax=Oryza sativa subsp. japonica TaxID=39947 RepID=Q6ZKC5_ORYSJ|nr:hypothetical protein [Oryza sativa Japonica Group]
MKPALVANLLAYWEVFLVTEFGMPILMPPASCHVLVPCLIQGRFDGRPIVYFWLDIGVKLVYQTPLRRYYQKNPILPAKLLNCQLHTTVVRVEYLSISTLDRVRQHGVLYDGHASRLTYEQDKSHVYGDEGSRPEERLTTVLAYHGAAFLRVSSLGGEDFALLLGVILISMLCLGH